jgi:hypothetical protein
MEQKANTAIEDTDGRTAYEIAKSTDQYDILSLFPNDSNEPK